MSETDERTESDAPDDSDAPLGYTLAGTARQVAPYRKYDWPAIHELYVHGESQPDGKPHQWLTLSAVAERFGVMPQRVREHSSREGWVEQRARYQREVESVRQVERAKRLAEDASKLEVDVIRASRMGVQLVSARLAELATAQQDRRKAGVADGRSFPLNAKELDALAHSLEQFHRSGLRALGQAETTTHIEHTGAAGGPIDMTVELRRDDPGRLADVLGVLGGLGLGDIIAGTLAETVDEGGAAASPAGGDAQ